MATVKLPDRLVDNAKLAAHIAHRSVPKQLEYWMTLGRACEDNPDLPHNFIKDILEAKADVEAGVGMTEFKFGARELEK